MNLFDTANSLVYDPFNPCRFPARRYLPYDAARDGRRRRLGAICSANGEFPQRHWSLDVWRQCFTGIRCRASPRLPPPTTTLTATPNASTGGSLVTLTSRRLRRPPGNLGTVLRFEGKRRGPSRRRQACRLWAAWPRLQIATVGCGDRIRIVASYSGGCRLLPTAFSNTVTEVVATRARKLSASRPMTTFRAWPAASVPPRPPALVVVFDQPVALDNGCPVACTAHETTSSGAASTNRTASASFADFIGIGPPPTTSPWVVTFVGQHGIERLRFQTTVSIRSKDGVYDLKHRRGQGFIRWAPSALKHGRQFELHVQTACSAISTSRRRLPAAWRGVDFAAGRHPPTTTLRSRAASVQQSGKLPCRSRHGTGGPQHQTPPTICNSAAASIDR